MKDRKLFLLNMATLGEVFDKQISDTLLEIYWRILEPFDDSQCISAFKRAVIELKFFPKPAELIEILQSKKEFAATNAWIDVLNAVRRIGCYRSVRFADPVIHSVVQIMGGWTRFADMTTDDEKWKQREFEKLYTLLSAQDGRHADYLPGIHESENSNSGWNVEPDIVQIGHTKQPMLIK